MLPGHTMEETQAVLQNMLHDQGIGVTLGRNSEPAGPPPPPLTAQIMGPVQHVAARMWPHIPIVPEMTAGATDGRYMNAAGVPTYGLSGMFSIPGENNAHGLNEKMRVKSLYDGRDFLGAVVREYAMQPR
jgi:acetylornithine deacetylase/succinyl-diaminopimelate desuccinylase-like protein